MAKYSTAPYMYVQTLSRPKNSRLDKAISMTVSGKGSILVKLIIDISYQAV